ncbi:bifunctional aspartate kinase/homoserine dehydrogenase I [Flexithrix dorotheae]|uniref:bifunctional aspartate kinase/homoserine dehydrogenase I n=1 Tax=Flexithrix dorotheae TaxID=70993 RepID=UPI000371719E|nr:bifunctional aspartate kinase/homoserine dehydrogenase I [Flexithrix dorotheae]
MRVLKFGGTSVGTPERILQVIEIVKDALQKEKVAVVVSAFGGITDQLIKVSEMASSGNEGYKDLQREIETRHIQAIKTLVHARRQSGVVAEIKFLLNELEDILHGIYLVKELSPKMKDFILSFGERLSASIIAEAFKEKEIDARFTDSRNLIITDKNFGNANVNFTETNERIQKHFINAQGELMILPGFVASTKNNETTTLGRGGSDYTASIFAGALHVEVLEIWTDVNGMMTADPRKVRTAFTIPEISYEEAMELSYFGAKVIYPPSIQPAYQKQIPILVKNTFDPKGKNTIISGDAPDDEKPIRGISSMKDIALVTLTGSGLVGVTGSASRLFNALAKSQINVILISQASSEHSITTAVEEKNAELASKVIYKEFKEEFKGQKLDQVIVEQALSIVAVVGKNMKKTPGVAGKLFSSLGRNGVNVLAIAQGASELNISLVVRQIDERKAVSIIHEAFFLSETKALHLFIAGSTGLIGKTLLSQITKQFGSLKENSAIDIRLIGLMNTRKMVIEPQGINPGSANEVIENADKKSSLDSFVDEMISQNLRNTVFVDATASQLISDQYEKILNANISIVTPNKLACSGDINYYKRLKKIARKRGAKFLFETNVGAGLPVISTLNDLIQSGDKIIKIEAILSGTLNYITNNVSKDKKISEVVLDAKEAGLTEPDPRIDLSGSDVARKILILARELGYDLNMEDVESEPFISKESLDASDISDFFEKLKAYDETFEKERSKLDAKDEKYRIIATLEDGKPKVKVKTFDKTHPFYMAEGSDNIILYTTNRYNELPLMIKGPGAGAEVTAAGVFADIIRIVD